MIRVAVVDDHPVVIAGVRAWCADADPPIEVVNADASPRAWQDSAERADVVLLDLQLEVGSLAFDRLQHLVDQGQQVIVYTMRTDRQTALTCLDIGAHSYLTKAEGEHHLVAAIHAAAENRPYMPPTLSGALATNPDPLCPRLAPREIDVLLEWFHSESKEMVARSLNLSVRTVNSYLDRVRVKYASVGRTARTKAALVARAIQDGLVHVDDL
ncbi:two component transcriptional regulator, LuxR family [Streptoalloteichus hindustanus]|uniref:Two component transcriptional regulator, LuxR family n=2 Tax=Streptoalloteichus hindustanus TaxID=2017 RepID=A0A1M5CFV9_STRHI|nr:two component transcriptional regulator, LuxR family [Streptoalloteichus hindustanus]